ncbi:MAG: methionyl-tRNA formyltransferase [Gammaproteobacteria bacterium RIFCSPHIGHO2_12_FULL_45_9]|nr:MAG: methionyl-tRNA formyltransferase [Gammaproteobacteria bacterium RIFCSPHIGHO2_12_FULL_45_9]
MSLRIVFAGTPAFAAESLQALLTHTQEVVAIYTQPDRPAGRGQHMQISAVKTVATTHAIPVIQPLSLKSPDIQAQLAAYEPDIMVVAAYGLLLPPAILNTPKLGCINVHASLLPRWRGASPIHQAILSGDTETGITIMHMDVGLDTGDMILQRSCTITPTDTAATLHDRLAILGGEALLEALTALEKGTATRTPQDHANATHAPKIQKPDARIQWQANAAYIARQVRAFNPWPIVHTRFRGESIKIWEAAAIEEPVPHGMLPGFIITATPHGLDVATGNGILRITQLQFPGGRPISVRDVFNAHSEWFAQPGVSFES